jgi:glycine cleavage system H lipoate-binding protein
MSCPFLQETSQRSCRADPIRKLVVSSGPPSRDERCSSLGFHQCPAFRTSGLSPSDSEKCPLLDERHVRYCSAASIPHYVPWSEQAGQCGGSGHRHCDLWLSMIRPRLSGHASREPEVNGIAVPPELWYSPNHLWLESDGDGACHIGIDAFLVRVLAKVDHITFVTLGGVQQPSVVLNVCGIDCTLVFPNKLMITGVNSHLRHAPERLIADPYGAGWLFEGWPVPSPDHGERAGLISGEQCRAWIKSEVDRLADFVHHLDPNTMNDGGTPADGFIQHLSREEVLRLFHGFCAPNAAWAT